MKNPERKEVAKAIANSYAAQPQDGYFIYAAVGIMLAGLAVVLLSRFYQFDFSIYPFSVAAVVALIGAGALLLRAVRSRRHKRAHRAEYDKMDPGSVPKELIANAKRSEASRLHTGAGKSRVS